MVDILKNFEQMASRLSPLVLIAPGLMITVLGLFVWLGGLGFRRALLALVGALSGGFCVLLVARDNAAAILIAALAAAFIGAFFQRFFAAALLAALSFAITFGIVARPLLQEYQGSLISGQIGRNGEILTVSESLDVLRAVSLDLADGIRYAARRLTPRNWALATAVSAGLLATGLLFRHVGGALSCSILGTGLLFTGLSVLIALKGAAPIARMQSRAPFYALVFLGMIVFGTLEQLVFCSHADPKPKTTSRKQHGNQSESKKGWRNR